MTARPGGRTPEDWQAHVYRRTLNGAESYIENGKALRWIAG
jgi:hypothetical protein